MKYYNKYFEGIFWISGKEENRIISTLFIDKKGNTTITSLQPLDINEKYNKNWDELNLVLGYINCHDKSKTYSIKLYNVYKTYQLIGPLTKFKYTSHNSLIASSYDKDINSTLYNTIMLSSDIINNWIPITGFNFKSNTDKSFKINQLYEQPKRIELFKNKHFEIYLFFNASAGLQNRRNSYIKENIFIYIETIKPFIIEELNKIKSTIERLFNIILFIPFHSSIVELKTTSKKTYKVIEKIDQLHPSINNKIDFETFRNNSQNIFSKWFEKQNDLELAIINFFSVYGQKGVLIENKFLTYISILENYHKNNINKKGYLKDRLKYLLEKSRINDKINDIDNYAEKLKTTRHYYSHLDEKQKEKSLNIEEIIRTNILLEFVIRELFLGEIGVKETSKIPIEIEKYLKNLND